MGCVRSSRRRSYKPSLSEPRMSARAIVLATALVLAPEARRGAGAMRGPRRAARLGQRAGRLPRRPQSRSPRRHRLRGPQQTVALRFIGCRGAARLERSIARRGRARRHGAADVVSRADPRRSRAHRSHQTVDDRRGASTDGRCVSAFSQFDYRLSRVHAERRIFPQRGARRGLRAATGAQSGDRRSRSSIGCSQQSPCKSRRRIRASRIGRGSRIDWRAR